MIVVLVAAGTGAAIGGVLGASLCVLGSSEYGSLRSGALFSIAFTLTIALIIFLFGMFL